MIGNGKFDQYIAEVDLNQLSGSQPLSLPEFSDWIEDDVPTDNNDAEHETEADNIGTSTIIHGNYDVLDSLVNKFAREEGFSVHRCRTKSEDKTFVQRGKFLCHKRRKRNVRLRYYTSQLNFIRVRPYLICIESRSVKWNIHMIWYCQYSKRKIL